jgi:hypothetical protein
MRNRQLSSKEKSAGEHNQAGGSPIERRARPQAGGKGKQLVVTYCRGEKF